MPTGRTLEATSASGAVATWTDPTVTDDVDKGLVAACAPVSGSTFPLGATTVTCSVTDSAAHTTSDTFTVTVVDTTAPTISGMPDDVTVAADGAGGTVVTWTAPTASDLVDGSVAVGCTPASGSTFAAGTATTVTCSATDAATNKASKTFTVTVAAYDDQVPVLHDMPTGRTLEATSASGAVATWTDPTVTDDVDSGLVAACAPVSGSTFPLGATTVTCSVTDSAAHTTTDTFTVTVRRHDGDPTISGMPDDMTVAADGPAARSSPGRPRPPPTSSTAASRWAACRPPGRTFAAGTPRPSPAAPPTRPPTRPASPSRSPSPPTSTRSPSSTTCPPAGPSRPRAPAAPSPPGPTRA